MGQYVKPYASLLTSADTTKARKFGDNRKTTPDGPEAQNLVRSEVYANFKYPKPSGHNISVPCCYHQQGEVFTRTLSINVVPHKDNKGREVSVGQYRCWSCGAKGGWNQLADHMRMARLVETDNPDLSSAVHHVEYEHSYTMPDPEDMRDLEPGWNWTKKGVTLFYNTLVRAGVKWYWHPVRRNGEWVKRKRLWLPANTQGEVVGHIGAYVGTNKNTVPYLNSKGQWASHYFFGFDEALRLSKQWAKKGYKKFCCVVEGPRDQLMMLQNRIPAVACLGSNSWSDAKANMLSVAFDYVFVIGDGDPAGHKLNKAVKQGLAGIVPVKVIKLRDTSDPASLTEREYRDIISIIGKYATQQGE